MKKKAILAAISLLLMCCAKSDGPINIEFSKSNEDVTLYYSHKTESVWAISLPFDMQIENSSNWQLTFRDFSYFYGSVKANRAIQLYLKEDGSLIKKGFSELKHIDGGSANSYLVRSKHSIDSTKISSIQFRPYIQQMQHLNQDTLNIGTISEVKAKHQGLLEDLVQNDSISLLFIEEDSDNRYRKEKRLVEY